MRLERNPDKLQVIGESSDSWGKLVTCPDSPKYIHYPHGDGSPDRYLAELYDMAHDPDERFNLIGDPSRKPLVASLRDQLANLMQESGLTPDNDKMPIDEGIGKELPDPKIR